MKPNHPNHDLPDFDADLENDAVWNLLEDTTPAAPSSTFAQDTLRRIRLEEEATKVSWWKSLLAPKVLLGATGAAFAAVAIVLTLNQDPVQPSPQIAETPEPTEDLKTLEDTFAGALLSGAAEDPSLLSDEEIVALLY